MGALYLLTIDVVVAILLWPGIVSAAPDGYRIGHRAPMAIALWLAGSALTLATLGVDWPLVASSHLVLAAIALATCAVALLCRRQFVEPLDAIAASLTVCCALGFGIFAIGRFAGAMPIDLLDVLLLTNPFVAVTSAAKIDLFRTELLYRASPLAHLLVAYPAWPHAAGFFVALAAVATGLARTKMRRPPDVVEA